MTLMEEKRQTKYVRALYNFERKHTDELSFKKDDIITVTQQFEGGWWEGTRDGRTGWFPSNYVVPVEETQRQHGREQGELKSSGQTAEVDEEQSSAEKIKECQNVILLHMIDGERTYINEITSVINAFFKPLQIFIEKLPNKKKISEIRATLESIFALQKNILSTLEDLRNRSDGASYLRIGAVFMNFAPTIGDLYETYAALHPLVVATLEKEKDLIKSLFDMSNFMFSLKHTKAQLRVPFDRLEKYPGLMIDLERYIEESHPDRGDLQRAVLVLKEVSENCTNIRKNKETELDILCSKIIGWQGERLSTFGEPALTLRVRHELAGDCVLLAFPTRIFLLSVTEKADVYRLQEKISIEGLVVESGGEDNNLLVLHCSHLSESLTLDCHDGVTRDKAVAALHQFLPQESMRSPPPQRRRQEDEEVQMRRGPPLPHHAVSLMTPPQQSPRLYRHTYDSAGIKTNFITSLSECIYKLSSAMSPKHALPRVTHHEPMSSLRPAPPLVPKFGSVPRSNSPKSNKLTRKKSGFVERQRMDRQKSIEELDRSIFRKPEPTGTMLEDAMILQVIESYCASSRARNTLDLAKLRLSDSEVRIGACLGAAGGIVSGKHASTSGVTNRQVSTVAAGVRDSTDGATCTGAVGPAQAASSDASAFVNSFGLPLPGSQPGAAPGGFGPRHPSGVRGSGRGTAIGGRK